MKTTRRNLDELLALTRENRPKGDLLPQDRLLDVVNQPPQGRLRSMPRQLTNRNRTNAMITISGLLITGAMLLYFGLSEPSVQPLQPGRSSSPVVANNHGESPSAPHHAGGMAKRDTTPVTDRTMNGGGDMEKDDDGADGDRIAVRRNGLQPANIDSRPDVPGIQISLQGRNDLARRLGIQFDGTQFSIDKIDHIALSDLSPYHLDELRKLGYALEGDSVGIRSRHVIAVLPQMGTRIEGVGPSDLPWNPSFLGAVVVDKNRDGVMTSVVGSHLQPELAKYGVDAELFNEELSALIGRYPDTTQQYDALERLVSVHTSISYVPEDAPSEITYDIYFWFKPDDHFLAALSSQLRRDFVATLESRVTNASRVQRPTRPAAAKAAKDIHPDIMVFAINQPSPDDTARFYPELRSNLDIEGIRYVDLTPAELAQLGVVDRSGKYSIPLRTRLIKPDAVAREALASLGYDRTEPDPLIDFDVTADTFELSFRPLGATEERRALAPVIVSNQWTDTAGRQGFSLFVTLNAPALAEVGIADKDLRNLQFGVYDGDSDDGDATASLMNRLIPVRFQLTSGQMIEKAGKNRGGEITLWYVPTDEFIDALPERYATPLRREIDAITAVEQEGRPSHEVCERIAGERTLLDYCRSSSGAISATQVAPNPISREASVRYALDQPRDVSVTLHDLSGRYLGTLVEQAARPTGVHEETVDLSGRDGGAYLVVIRSDKGEQAIQRVIVR